MQGQRSASGSPEVTSQGDSARLGARRSDPVLPRRLSAAPLGRGCADCGGPALGGSRCPRYAPQTAKSTSLPGWKGEQGCTDLFQPGCGGAAPGAPGCGAGSVQEGRAGAAPLLDPGSYSRVRLDLSTETGNANSRGDGSKVGSWSAAKRFVRLPEVTSLPAVWQCSTGEKDPSCRWHLLVVLGLRARYSEPACPGTVPARGVGRAMRFIRLRAT